MTVMAILQNVDKCIRCNGCVIGCKRTWKMKADNPGVHKLEPDSRVMVKSQQNLDAGPFMRYSCWHCPDPPCAKRCPFKAITKEAEGAVTVDHKKCDPGSPLCTRQCVTDCQRGGYPKVGNGSNMPVTGKPAPGTFSVMQKCTLCNERINVDTGVEDAAGTRRIDLLPTKDPDVVAHQPTCVFTCPSKAMTYDTRDHIIAQLATLRAKARANGYPNAQAWGDGSMFWFSSKPSVPPKADPFVEDHVSPLLDSILDSPPIKLGLVSTLAAAGLAAYAVRRAANNNESEGEVG